MTPSPKYRCSFLRIALVTMIVGMVAVATANAGNLVFPATSPDPTQCVQTDVYTGCLYGGFWGGYFYTPYGATTSSYVGGALGYCYSPTFNLAFGPRGATAATVTFAAGGGDGLFLQVVVHDFPDGVNEVDTTTLYPFASAPTVITANGAQMGDVAMTVVDSHGNVCWGGPGTCSTSWEVSAVSVTEPDHPSVTLNTVRNGDGTYSANIGYGFSGSGTITLVVLPTADEPGITLSGPATVSGSGTAVQPLPPFDTDRTLEAIATTSGDCGGTSTAEAAVGCTECKGPPKSVGGPIRLFDGVMTYTEPDPLPATLGSEFRREYSSGAQLNGRFGLGWHSIFDASALATDATQQTVSIVTEDRGHFIFRMRGDGNWWQSYPAEGVAGTLTGSETTSYTFREGSGSLVRTFGTNHRLTRLQDLRRGRAVSITYDASGNPTGIADEAGSWSAAVTTTNGKIMQIAVNGRPDLTWTYAYSSTLLTSVSVANTPAPWRTYQYTNNRLSSVIDATGNVLERHDYDSLGRAVSSYDGSSGDITNLSYAATDSNGVSTTQVTRADSSQATYQQAMTAGSVVTQYMSGGCSACGSNDATAAYESHGNLFRLQNARGYVTESTYDTVGRHLVKTVSAQVPSGCDPTTDPAHCRLSSSALAIATLNLTSASQTRTYTYGDTSWPAQPTQIGRDSVAKPGSTSTESFTFDPATGEALVHAVSGAINSGTQETHTTTTALYGATDTAAFNPGGAFQSAWLSLPQPAGLKKSVDGPRTDVADVTSFVYYPFDPSVPGPWRGRLAAVRNAAGQMTQYSDYDVFGHAATITDPNGVVTRLTFDPLGRLLTSTIAGVSGCNTSVDPLCTTDLTTTRTYASGTGPLLSEQRPAGNVTSYTYDARGRILTVTRGTSSASVERTAYTWDPTTGKKSSETLSAYQNGSWVTTKSETYTYTSDGNLSSVIHADNTRVVYGYLPDGTLASVQDENHTTPNTLYAYDPANHLASVTQTLATAPGGQIVTNYAYDVAGNLVSVTDPNGNVTTYAYDDFGRMQQQVSPVSGTTTYGYDPAWNLLTTTDANGATTTRTWDALNRVTSSASTRGGNTESVTWTYDDATAGNFGLGRAATMTDPTGSTSYQYERRGLLRQESKTINGSTYNTTYAYDVDGNRGTITDPSGLVERYGFDFADRPYSLSAGTTAIVSAATYLPFGPLTSLTFGNGTSRTMQYDDRYRPVENKVTGPAGTLADYTYAEDNVGNITQIHDATNAGYNRDFGYDDLNRLTTANSGAQLWGAGSYTYDAMGNMLTSSLGSWKTTSATFAGTTPKLSTVIENGVSKPVAYDAAGNELNAGTSSYAYSPRNQLISADVASYAYDGRGVMSIGSVAFLAANAAPSAVTGGGASTGTITLNLASTTDTVVALSSSNSSLWVPSSVTVPTGSTTASFSIATNPVVSDTPVTITASFQQSVSTTSVTIRAPQLASISVSPSTVAGGSTCTGTVTLTGAAAANIVVILSSNDSAATVPASVTVPAASSTATFTINTSTLSADTSITITGTLNQTAQTAALRVLQPQLVSISISPGSIVSGSSGTATVSLNTPAVTSDFVSLSAVSADLSANNLTIPAGASNATFSFTASRLMNNVSATGSISATFDNVTVQSSFTDTPPTLATFSVSPTAVVGGANLTAQASVSGYVPWYGLTIPLTSTSISTVYPLSGITMSTSASTGTAQLLTAPVASQTSVVVSASQGGVAQSSAIALQPVPVTISSFAVSPTTVTGSNPVTGTITLTAAAPSGGVDVDIATNASLVSPPFSQPLPAFVHVPAGASSASFTIDTVETFDSINHNENITVMHSARTISASLTLTAAANWVGISASGGVSTSSGVAVQGGTSLSGLAYLINNVSQRTAISLTSSNSAIVSVPSSVTVPKGAWQAPAFTIKTFAVTAPATATITATYGGVSSYVSIIVLPPNAVTVQQVTVRGSGIVGQPLNETGTVYLTGPAPAGGALVTLGSTRVNLVDISTTTITIPANATSGTFTLTEHQFLGYPESTDIIATYMGIAQSNRLTVQPVTPPSASLDSPTHAVVRCASLSLAPCLTGIGLHAATTIATSDPARYYLYTPELQLMAETVQSTSSTKPIADSYLWFGGQPVAQIDATTNITRWYAVDHLGTPFLQTDATGAVVWRAEYTPHGDVFAFRAGSTLHEPLRLPGQTTTDGNALYNNVYRWYRSGWGRYTQADPVFAKRSSAYGYADNRPLVASDPLGLFKWLWTWTVHTTPDPSTDCNGAATPVECAQARSVTLDCACGCRGSSTWRPEITAYITMDIFILPNAMIHPGMTADRTVHDQDSAVQHVENVHVIPAAASLRDWLSPLEKDGTKQECEATCGIVKQQNKVAFVMFQSGLKKSQDNGN